jgi:adenylate kinase
MRVVLLGPPGAGKGTQAERLSRRLGVPHISTGAMLREAILRETDLGRAVREYVESGRLVPDPLMEEVLETRLREPDSAAGFVLDGYPRTTAQAESLDRFLTRQGWHLDRVVLLEVPPEELVERLSGRLVCPLCGANYHPKHRPPRRDQVCDVDQAPLAQRSDDQPETVLGRLKLFELETGPVVAYYGQKGLLTRVPGSGTIEQVQDWLWEAVASGPTPRHDA